jgi:hypothetical protein
VKPLRNEQIRVVLCAWRIFELICESVTDQFCLVGYYVYQLSTFHRTTRTDIPENTNVHGRCCNKMYWLFGRKSLLSLRNKILLYKTILKPIRTYGIQLWGTASTSNVEILERFQSKALRLIVGAPWYVPNILIRHDLHMRTVKEEIRHFSSHYSLRLSAHPNDLILPLVEPPEHRRLRRFLPNDLHTRF